MAPEQSTAYKGLIQVFIETITINYFNAESRASRREFWLFQLASLIITFAFITNIIICISIAIKLDILKPNEGKSSIFFILPFILFELALITPSICITIRRLHDAGFSGWFILLNFIPTLCIILLIFILLPSQQLANKYGPSPYAIIDDIELPYKKVNKREKYNLDELFPNK